MKSAYAYPTSQLLLIVVLIWKSQPMYVHWPGTELIIFLVYGQLLHPTEPPRQVWAFKILIATTVLSPNIHFTNTVEEFMFPYALCNTKHYPIFILCQSDRGKMCFVVILICISSTMIKIKHIFIYLRAIFSFWELSVHFLCLIFHWVIGIFLIDL